MRLPNWFRRAIDQSQSPAGFLARLGIFTTGSIFYVDSTNTRAVDSASNSGDDPSSPFATIDYAIGKCTASKGDVIIVAPGHAETITAAAAIALDVAGISIIGLGNGTNKPTITFGTNTTATISVTADNCRISGLRLVNNIDSLAVFIADGAEYTTLTDLDFVTSSAKEALCFVSKTTTKDYLTIERCTAYQPTDPAGSDGGAGTGFLYLVDSENIMVRDCHFRGNFETAIFHNKTTACKNLWVIGCTGIQELSGAEPFQLVAGATGATVGGGFNTPAEIAATEATLVGTLGDGFFISPTTGFGNDGGAGGQGAIIVTTAS